MSLALLGENFDLHSGGQDLKFPHHENERAQAVALGRGFARHWAHNGWVEVDGVKMSKSLDNFTTLADLLARADARAYRLLLLRAHYRGPDRGHRPRRSPTPGARSPASTRSRVASSSPRSTSWRRCADPSTPSSTSTQTSWRRSRRSWTTT